MPERLNQTLIRLGKLDATSAARALQRQVLLGGALDTALLELAAVQEADLGEALALAYSHAAASLEECKSPVEPRALRHFPEQWAKKYLLAPLWLDETLGRLVLLSPAPPDLGLVSRLSELLELELVPLLAPEARVHERLSLLYQIPLPERFAPLLGDPMRSSARTRQLAPKTLSFGEAVNRLREAKDRDEVVRVALAYAIHELQFAAMLVHHEDRLEGWLGAGPGQERAANVKVALTTDSAFKVVVDTRAHYLGPLPQDPLHEAFLEQLGRPHPRAVLIVPVRLKNRTVALLYGDNGPQPIAPRLAADLMLFCTHLQLALEGLLVRMKAESLADLPAPAPLPDELPILPPEDATPAMVGSWSEQVVSELPVIATEYVAEPPLLDETNPAYLPTPAPTVAQPTPTPQMEFDPVFVANDTEFEAKTTDSEADDQPLESADVVAEEVAAAAQGALSEPEPEHDSEGEPLVLMDIIEEDAPDTQVTRSPLRKPEQEQLARAFGLTPPSDDEGWDAVEAPGGTPTDFAITVEETDQTLDPTERLARLPRLGAGIFGPGAFEDAINEPEPLEPQPPPAPTVPLRIPNLHTTKGLIAVPAAQEDDQPLPLVPEADTWEPVEVDDWNQHPRPPIAVNLGSAVQNMRSSLTEDSTVPDLSAEAWLRASSEIVRPRPLPPEVVERAALPPSEPVRLSRILVHQRTVPTGDLQERARDQHDTRRDDDWAEPVPLTTRSNSSIVRAEALPPVDEAPLVEHLEEQLSDDQPSDDPLDEPVPLTHRTGSLSPLDPLEAQGGEFDTEIEAWIEQLSDPDPGSRAEGLELLQHTQAEAVLPRLVAHFPGPLVVDPFQAGQAVPPFGRCGLLLEVLEHFGPAAHPHLVRRLDIQDALQRFFAVYFYATVYVPEVIPRLIPRLHDEEPRICMLAARTLFGYRQHPDYRLVLEHLHGRLEATSLAARRHAAHLVGLLRDVTAIPKLIDILDKKDKAMVEVAEDTLAEITKQRLGVAKKWRAWWEKNQRRSRIAWLVEGLSAKEPVLRRSAAEELRAITSLDLGYDDDAPKKQREEARMRWVKWWEDQEKV